MKISGRIDGSIYGAILCSRPRPCRQSSVSASDRITTIAATKQEHGGLRFAAATHAVPVVLRLWQNAPSPRLSFQQSSKPIQSQERKLFSSLHYTVTNRAGRRPLNPTYFTSHIPLKQKWNHTCSSAPLEVDVQAPAETPSIAPFPAHTDPHMSKEELLGFLDYYDDVSVEERLEFLKDPYMRKYAPPEDTSLNVSDRIHELVAPAPEEVERGSQEDMEVIAKLRAAVYSRLLRPHSVDLETIYDLYLLLPGHRIPYMSARLRHSLFAALGITERKSPKAMLRYFAVVADTKASGFALSRTEWNTAMSFASRYVGTSTDVEAEAALHLWREMEQDVGVRGNEATFNILFDVAAKAGKFALAEMIYQEMNTRGFHFNRFHHVSLIHFFGLKMDAGGVRAAYREMVNSSEIIDTTVLNCVLVGLLRSGEEASAERLYNKMKATDRRSKIIPERNYTSQKKMTKVLLMFARLARKHPELQRGFQSTSPTTPDLYTYRILVNHFGVRLGDLSRVAQFLDEMKFFRVPLHGSVFLALFKSFAQHGSDGSDWSVQRLDSVWNAFLDAHDAGTDGLYISTWMAMWILRSFAHCTRSQDRVLEVYEELSLRWDLDSQNRSFMLDFLHKLFSKRGLYLHTTETQMLNTAMTSALGHGHQGFHGRT
ncbi:hypothetical protein PG993_007277 [Apiospora rasikravindrae]|uniref:Pentatricopeptide repeat protein n=1 Tax=Apiospora rasikravindrae TaxID=990691 RepID=A0ABR1SX16_9PEZI